MSNTQHGEALLDDYAGPLFPGWLGLLGAQLYRGSCFELLFQHAGETVPGFQGMRRNALTSDGYYWPHVMVFRAQSGTFVILMPWQRDIAKTGGTPADRSMAVYCQGDVSEPDMAEAAEYLTATFKRFRDEADAEAERIRLRRGW